MNGGRDALAAAVTAVTGIVPTADQLERVRRSLSKRGLSTGDWRGQIESWSRGDDAAWAELIDVLTVRESFLFRNKPHFDALATIAADPVFSGRPLRVLSAGCARGEEPLSVAILCDQLGRDCAVTAFDIHESSLALARSGIVRRWSMRQTPPDVVAKYFRTRPDGSHQLVDRVLERVRFRRLNFAAPGALDWATASFDVVICRNILMYFEAETAARCGAALCAALAKGGYLFLGHAESPRKYVPQLRAQTVGEAIVYRKLADVCKTHGSSRRAGRHTRHAPVAASTTPASAALGRASDATAKHLQSAQVAAATAIAASPRSSRSPRLSNQATRASADAAPAALTARVESRALSLLRAEQYDAALGVLDAAGAAAQGDLALQLMHTVANLNAGNIAEATEEAERLVAQQAIVADGHYLLALCLRSSGDIEGEAAALKRALYLDRSFASAHLALAHALVARGEWQAARRRALAASRHVHDEREDRVAMYWGAAGRPGIEAAASALVARVQHRAGTK